MFNLICIQNDPLHSGSRYLRQWIALVAALQQDKRWVLGVDDNLFKPRDIATSDKSYWPLNVRIDGVDNFCYACIDRTVGQLMDFRRINGDALKGSELAGKAVQFTLMATSLLVSTP